MVGDRLTTDVQGAQSAGLRAVWVNRSGSVLHDGIVPDWEISTLDELVSLLKAATTKHTKE
jgi:putative hydrolase of the HAD superfamily